MQNYIEKWAKATVHKEEKNEQVIEENVKSYIQCHAISFET